MGTASARKLARAELIAFSRAVRYALIALLGLTLSTLLSGQANAITNGRDAVPGEQTWVVALVDSRGDVVCTGVLISDWAAATAAHCVAARPADDLAVRVRGTNSTNAAKAIAVTDIAIHEDFSSADLTSDLAVLHLAHAVPEEVGAAPIAVSEGDAYLAAGAAVRVGGWGSLEPGAALLPNVLQVATLHIVSDAECDAALREFGGIDEEVELCAQGSASEDTCLGDSGAPLVVGSGAAVALVGLASWGVSCGGDTPGVYVDAAHFGGWLNAQISEVQSSRAEADPHTMQSSSVIRSIVVLSIAVASLRWLSHVRKASV